MPTQEVISTKLLQIEQDIFATYTAKPSLSVMCGNGALPIFYYSLYHTYQDETYREKAEVILDHILDQLNQGITSFTYCDGLTGVATMLSYLVEKEFIGDEMDDFLSQCDEALFKVFTRLMAQADLDYLHGSLGVATYFLNRYRTSPAVLPQLLTIGAAIHEHVAHMVDPATSTAEVFNCGMAHGQVSSLIFLTKYHTLAPNPAAVAATIRLIAQRLLGYQSANAATLSIFPAIVQLAGSGTPDEAAYSVPNGWCYGDTMISLGLLAAGQTLHDADLVAEATALALRTTARNSCETAIINDGGMCHGSAGLAHMYKKWHQATGIEAFEENHLHWLRQTLELTNHADGLGGFKKFEGNNKYSNKFGLLDGASGVGLVLADYVHGQPSDWDRFFSLS
ncbi:lanthionine synthetase C family protein [Hymenobacter lucidus]|uniref:Lanthionine synthetase C family protein n=1 Tax=Hymenobacter lucidus TaxID=2880930 RepID=A0ABS8AVX9_9BACT|nr:lanthionine synthetase C family protein [Hymenobacter lucidus]MCB2409846.1 lanthionine synthetase C family protein [Hymenobacter lucidus]